MEKKKRLGRGLEEFSDLFSSSTETKKEDVYSQVIEPHVGKNLTESIATSGNRVQKMRLRATYCKDANGSIILTIKVLDQGDFPTSNIFRSTSDDPAGGAWDLGEGMENAIAHTSPTSDEARQWVLARIKILKLKLDGWRNIWVPQPEEFQI